MKYLRKLGLFASAILLGLTFMAASASAQVRFGISFGRPYYPRPVVRRYYAPPPVVYGYGYNYYGNPYYGNQYYWNRPRRYYDRSRISIGW